MKEGEGRLEDWVVMGLKILNGDLDSRSRVVDGDFK